MNEAKLKSVLEKRNQMLSSFAAIHSGKIEQDGDGFHLALYADEKLLTDNVRSKIETALHGIPLVWIFAPSPPEAHNANIQI